MRKYLQVVPEEGGEFQMFGGSVVGKFLLLKPFSEILLEWRFRNWKESDVSKVGNSPPPPPSFHWQNVQRLAGVFCKRERVLFLLST
jgi:hypothetical protein